MSRELLGAKDEKTVNYVSMVLHTCLDEAKVEDMSEPQNIQLALRVMELCRTQPDLDWTYVCICVCDGVRNAIFSSR